MTARHTRRRFLGIAASVGGMALLPPFSACAAGPGLHVWRGVALGADACLQLHHPDPAEAERLIRLCLAEVGRLERLFSLYRPDSLLVHLNRTGELAGPPQDMVRLLSEAVRFSRLTDGAFDVTVQPLWQLYAEHFARPSADPAGPPPAAVEAVRSLIDYRALRIEEDRVSFNRHGMAATLNGIAQGYITDRVADRLRAEGMTNVLVDMGEVLAVGGHPDGRPWRVGLRGQDDDAPNAEVLEIADAAVATSSCLATRFDVAGRFGHIFNPATGRSANETLSVTVTATNATAADALSTALTVMSADQAAALLDEIPNITMRISSHDTGQTPT
ncbi:FAD:protein FMN transferase [Skermanella aerolata]|uniref:FAD:protein FMN transferase n=1 Tax=Skermanella aerolata TaxID=393310 RepID=A0A512DRI1_9PROT|nr:FAD:protein FMN transferase [Skermanella aerolata]KJB93149.1 thiamine biosynthesis protein ApbE [Skermanella aerolata KACC 11604]GEO39101.1 FAD:protein FMN transferase [Skermanella aerolata]